MSDRKQIKFYFQPHDAGNNLWYVEKEDGGAKKKYLRGIASGTSVDGHGERITDQCIKSFHGQANSGDILLYADQHGVKYTEDIGTLVKSEVMPGGDWFVEFRLYDAADNVGQNTLERVDKLWKQVNGLPPYKKPHQRGFSIEGFIPDNGILTMSGDGKRVINSVELDGCVVVPRPAYKTSIAHAVYKALDEPSPWVFQQTVHKTLTDRINNDDIIGSFFKQYYQLNDALDEAIKDVMSSPYITDKRERLTMTFDEYRDIMLDIILNNATIFTEEVTEQNSDPLDEVLDVYKPEKTGNITILKSLLLELNNLQKSIEQEN